MILFSKWLAFIFLPFLAFSPSSENPPVQALLTTGGGWHDYEAQEKLLINGINKRSPVDIEWTVIHEGDGEADHHLSLMQEENWTEGFDVIVHNNEMFEREEFLTKVTNGLLWPAEQL